MKLFTSRKVLGLSALAATLIASLSAFTIVNNASAYAEETEVTTPVGITSINVSLSEDIIVKLHTSATTDDGSKVVVNYGGEDTEIAINASGVFKFAKVTPQNLNDVLTATMYSAEGTQIGESATFSVQSYLENLLALDYENSNCQSELQYTAMKELAVNMLNYGAAAQEYTNHDRENLANKNLTEEQKALATAPITVSESDLAVSGNAWVGAGVRFDYKLGLYYVFQAESLDGITATVDGLEVEPEVYDASKNWYVIRYNGFTATNMNSVITAKLSQEGKEDQTFAYSVKSYVAAKGNDNTKLANLVNATYTYGYAAVAYSAEYTTVDATLESAGSISMDQKGYDFSGSKYGGVVILPALNLTDYSVVTAKGGSDAAPVATTKFTLISDTVDYTASVTSNSYFVINNGEAKYYSRYDCSLANNENETLSWDEETGYFNYNAVNPVTYSASSLTLRAYGTMAILVGDITLNFSSRWGFNNGLIIGNGTDATTVTLTSSATDYALVPFDGSYLEIRNNATLDITGSGSSGNLAPQNGGDVFVAEGGTLNVKANAGDAIKAPNTGSRMIVDGTVTATGNVSFAGGAITSDTEEYGFAPAIYVRKGTITISGRVWTNSLQIGSEELNAYGTLNVTASKDLVQTVSQTTLVKHVLAKGTFNAKNTSTTARCAMKIDTSNTGYLDVKEEMTINLTGSFGSVFGEWKAGTYHVAIQEGAIVSPDAKIAHSKLTVYIYTWKTATININGTEKEVIIVNTLTCPEGTPYYTFNGIDRPSVVEEATYTSTENTVSCGHLGTFNEATYTDADSITHTIYYQEIA